MVWKDLEGSDFSTLEILNSLGKPKSVETACNVEFELPPEKVLDLTVN